MLFHLQLLSDRSQIWGAVVPDPSTGTVDVLWSAWDLVRFSGKRYLPKSAKASSSTLASLLFPSPSEELYGEKRFLAKKMVPTRVARQWTDWERLRKVRLAHARTDVVLTRGKLHPVLRLSGDPTNEEGTLFWDEWLPVFLRDCCCGRQIFSFAVGLPPPPPSQGTAAVLTVPPGRKLSKVPEELVIRDTRGRTVTYRKMEDYVFLE